MGKRIAVCLILLMLIAPVAVVTAGEINVAVEGSVIFFEDVRPIEYYGHILVPVRIVFERMGFDVDWIRAGGREIVALNKEDTTIQIILGELYFTINGVSYPLGTTARSVDGSIKVPIRPIAEGIGMTVAWYENYNLVHITEQVQQQEVAAGQPVFVPTLPPGVPAEFMPTAPPPGLHDTPPAITPPVQQVVVTPPPPPPPPVVVPVIVYTIQPGDTLSRIARLHFPELNHDDNRIHRQAIDQIVRDNAVITNADRIQVGWVIRIYPFGTVPTPIPTPEDVAAAEAAREFPHLPVQHRIMPNENLDIIARRHFPMLDLDVLELRLAVIAQIARDNGIANPNLIVSGTYITINPFVRR